MALLVDTVLGKKKIVPQYTVHNYGINICVHANFEYNMVHIMERLESLELVKVSQFVSKVYQVFLTKYNQTLFLNP